jgi:hypothetical protein
VQDEKANRITAAEALVMEMSCTRVMATPERQG